MTIKTTITIYTDGSCNNHTKGPGGWAFYSKLPNNKEFCRFGMIPKPTTNNVAELAGVLMAMKVLGPSGKRLNIISDSRYVVDGMNKWCDGWAEKDFEGIKNNELWKQMKHLKDMYRPTIQWVRGHIGVHGNEKADKWCGLAAKNMLNHMVTENMNFRSLHWGNVITW
ncbi:MAG: hypothetical protein KAS32_23545 [Candidatus Peribacteraceae bacterium]|nr:hypothetical protein [Candidatus Peribacteraceae bacterium]